MTKPFTDTFNIGQRRVAQIRRDMAVKEMADTHLEAFGLQYENPEWRAMRRRQFQAARAEHDRALAVLAECN